MLGDLMTQSSDLVKGKVALVKAEFHEKARLYSAAALLIAIGGACGLLAAMALRTADIIALASYAGLVMLGSILGVALGVAAAILIMHGLRTFEHHSLG
ncbi:MAG TPA: phage holin family protein [Blastocatellia bacterium]|nr:phage holin family protein [Blastocatellia bacterium]